MINGLKLISRCLDCNKPNCGIMISPGGDNDRFRVAFEVLTGGFERLSEMTIPQIQALSAVSTRVILTSNIIGLCFNCSNELGDMVGTEQRIIALVKPATPKNERIVS